MPTEPLRYTCAICGHTYQSVTDAEERAEKDALFPDVPIEECVIVCDDCWRAGWSRVDPEMVA